MKKILSLIAASALLVSVFAGCGGSGGSGSSAASSAAGSSAASSAAGSSAAASSAAGSSAASGKTFTVGFDKDFPPYGFVDDNGEFTGFDIELAMEAAKRMGMTFKGQPIDWDAKDMELQSGSIDCIWNGFTINGREDKYTWSKPYVNNSQVFVVRKDSGIKTFDDLKGKIVSVQTDSSAQEALNDEKNAAIKKSLKEIVTCKEYNTAFMDLQSGAIDAIAMDVGVAKYQITTRKADFVVLEGSIADEQYGIGFLKGNTELKDKVEAALTEMVKDGTFATISKKYFNEDVGIFK
ncbi:MAG: amino acid ABC transporter substrate-binding protein [Lachnospiraceae bacterium]|nr:amino acid ABC transporter substrate-binding protein [Lachnospiraceae bacterium]